MATAQRKVVHVTAFETTLLGARVVRVEGCQEELVGQTLPWSTGVMQNGDGDCCIRFMDQYGEARAVARVSEDRVRTVRRSVARARRASLGRGDYDLTVLAKKSERAIAIAVVAGCLILIAFAVDMLLPISRGVLASSGQHSAPWVDIVTIVLYWFMFLHMPVIFMVGAIGVARRNVRICHVSRDGLVATTWHDEECVLPRHEIRSMRQALLGYVIEADGCPALRLDGKHASYVLESWAQKISPRRKFSYQRWLMYGFVIFQVGGVIAYFMHQAGMPIGVATHPVISYLFVGWGYPAVVVVYALLQLGIRRCAEWLARIQRRADRSKRKNVAGQARAFSAL